MPSLSDTLSGGPSRCGGQVLTAGFDSTVKIWDLRMGLKLRATLAAPPGAGCTRLAYDDTRIVTGSLSGAILCFDFL